MKIKCFSAQGSSGACFSDIRAVEDPLSHVGTLVDISAIKINIKK